MDNNQLALEDQPKKPQLFYHPPMLKVLETTEIATGCGTFVPEADGGLLES